MTQLYTKVLLNIVLRNIQKKDAFKNILSLPSFAALPKDLQQSFWHVCEFAFHALERNQIVFSEEELVEFFPQGLALDDKILCFGLLQSAETVLETGHGLSFHFLHLTFQEFLASLHLARQPPDKQLEVFRSHPLEPDDPDHYNMVWRFFFGTCSEIERLDIKEAIHLRKEVYGIRVSDYDYLSLCHCSFEAQNDLINDEVSHIFNDNPSVFSTFGYPHTAHDCTAVLHVIANMQKSSDMIITFRDCGVREKQIRILTDILASKRGKLQVSELNLSDNTLTVQCVSDLFHRASLAFWSLTKLNLTHTRISLRAENESTITSLSKSCSGRYESDLSGVFDQQVIENAVSTFDQKGSLTSDDTSSFVEALSAYCPHLRELNLSQNNLGVPGASALAVLVSRLNNNSLVSDVGHTLQQHGLTDLCLNMTNLGDSGLCAFVEGLEGVHHLRTLLLSDNSIHATGVSCLADALCTGKVLVQGRSNCGGEIDLSNNPVRLEGTVAVGRMLSSDHCHPEHFNLSRCQLTIAGGGPANTDSRNNLDCNIPGELVSDIGQRLYPFRSQIVVILQRN